MMDFLEIKNKIRENIKRTGFHVMYVGSDGINPSFSYTIGLLETYRHPEIITFGIPYEYVGALFHNAVDIIEDEGRIECGKLYDSIANYPSKFIEVTSANIGEYMHWIENIIKNKNPEAIQLLWTDEDGFFPDDTQFNKNMVKIQPMLNF